MSPVGSQSAPRQCSLISADLPTPPPTVLAMVDVPVSTDDQRPLHVACIMDGNGRWAKRRNLPRTEGHTEGEENLAAWFVLPCSATSAG